MGEGSAFFQPLEKAIRVNSACQAVAFGEGWLSGQNFLRVDGGGAADVGIILEASD